MGNPWDYDLTAIGARAAPLLIVLGSDAGPAATEKGGYRVSGSSDVYKLLPETMPFEQLNLSKQFLRQRGLPDLARYDQVLNLITDPDQHRQSLETLRKLLRGYRGRVLNRPESILRSTRDLVAKRLAGIDGLHVPGAVRLHNARPGAALAAAERAAIAFPAILRRAGTHGGNIVGRIDSLDDLRAGLSEPGDYLLTEFVDFRSADGLYRKYRLWSFGGKAVLRHMLISDNWNVHVRERARFMVDRPQLIDEEVRALGRSEGAFPEAIHAMFRAVRERVGLDFFGMDFGIDGEGRAVLFEANATMSFFPLVAHPRFAYLEQILAPARTAFEAMLAGDR
jgi:glutathione synthase/RimK-type ligase-like ATP-grasp enzyme